MNRENTLFVARVCLMSLLLWLIGTRASAQAFDGDADLKAYAGYLNVGGKSGFELGMDNGFTDYLSYGIQIDYLLVEKDPVTHEPDSHKCFDVSGHLNYHWSQTLKLPPMFDIYTGITAGSSVVGIHSGLRYNFGEVVGIYGEAQYNPIRTFGSNSDYPSLYKQKLSLSAGLTLSF